MIGWLGVATPPLAVASDTALVGGPPAPVAAELEAEKTMMRVPPAAAMSRASYLSAVPHRAGTPADYATAMYVSSASSETASRRGSKSTA